MKRILLLTDDSMVANFHCERLQAAGFSVETARDTEAAVKLLAERPVDLALTDPILTGSNPFDTLKAVRSRLGNKPLIVFSKLPASLASTALAAGATKLLSCTERPAAEVLRQIQTTLGLPLSDPQDADQAWMETVVQSAPEAINAMRLAMHGFVKDPRNVDALFALFREVHRLSERVAMIGLQPIYKLTSAIEALVYDLYLMPEQINPSVIRTISQSLDLLTAVFQEDNLRRAQDPSLSDVFVVDDEADARKLVIAAMQMINVKITCAADADMALSVLEDNSFNLIFLDINLHKSGAGFELCGKVRQIEEHRKTPVVFLTGMATLQNRAQSSLSGGNDFVGKPFNLLELGVKALMWIFKSQLSLA